MIILNERLIILKSRQMVNIGEKAPDFALQNQYGDTIRLQDFAGRPLVIFSFPQAGTPDCTRQACKYRDEYENFIKLKASVVGISASSIRSLRVWHREHNFPFDLLSDEDHTVLESYGAWGQNIIGVLELPFSKRSFWVMDGDGIIRAQEFNIDPVASIDKSLEIVKKLIAS